IAIDDFGTGYSSLSYLRRFPLDRLKIDRVFVSNLEENEEDRLIVTSIASLAHILGLEIVAEGIEEPFQASFLKNIGCEYFQGYLTGKPMPVDAFIEFARHNPEHSEWLEEPSKFRSEHSLESKARKVKWKKSFSTDVVSVDNEHRALIDALNTFSDLYMKDPESIDITETLDVIALEAIKHFDHEEDVMFNIGYPRYEMHREKHKWLIADIAKRKLEISEHKQGTSFDEVLQYLKYWLLRHLVSEDTHLHRFINKPSSERRT
ncbi:MAG: EAL domain-containing protein, partial [Candidatus Thiodiazotropha taylori]